MEDRELVKRLDEVNDRLDELLGLAKQSGDRVEAVFKFVGDFEARVKLDMTMERPFGVTAGDRVAYCGRFGTVIGVGPSIAGPQAVVAMDDPAPNEGPRQLSVSLLTRIDEERTQ